MPTFNWDFENQQIKSGILTQLSCSKSAESNFLEDERGPQQGDPGSCLVLHLYLYNYYSDLDSMSIHCPSLHVKYPSLQDENVAAIFLLSLFSTHLSWRIMSYNTNDQ